MTETTSFTRLLLPAQVMGYTNPPDIDPPRLPRIWTTIATYPSAAAIDLSSTLKPSGNEVVGKDSGGAGSLPDGIGKGTDRIPYSKIEGLRGWIGKRASRVWTWCAR